MLLCLLKEEQDVGAHSKDQALTGKVPQAALGVTGGVNSSCCYPQHLFFSLHQACDPS